MGELEAAGFDILVSPSIHGIFNNASNQQTDVILIDDKPTLDVLDLIDQLRATSDIGIMILTDNPTISVAALEKGADDCIARPKGGLGNHQFRELQARLRNLTWRLRHQYRPEEVNHDFAGWSLTANSRTLVSPTSEQFVLSRSEFLLLMNLVGNAGQVMSRDQLTLSVCNRRWFPEDRYVDVLVSHLRRIFRRNKDEFIITVQGVGYVFSATPLPVSDS